MKVFSRLFRIGILRSMFIAAGIGVLASGQAQAQSGKPLVKVRLEEVVRSVLYVPNYVALSQGFFKDAGLDVTMRTAQGGDKATAALLSGSADVVLLGAESTVYVQNSESPVKARIFAGLTATDGFMLMSRAPADKFDWSKMKGKSILAFRPGSSPDIYMEAALRKNGIEPKKDITIINNVGVAARPGAWLSGQGDYAIFLEPEAGMLEKEGKSHIVASIGQEVGQIDYTVFTTTDAYIKKNPQAVQALTDAIARSLKYVENTPSSELAKQIAEFFPAVPRDQLVSTIDRYKKYRIWKSTPVVEPAAIEKLQDMLVASGVLENGKRVKVGDILTNDFAKRVK